MSYDYGGAGYGASLMMQNAAMNTYQGTPSLRDQMEMRLESAKAEVKRVEELLKLMDRNPDVQRIMELLRP